MSSPKRIKKHQGFRIDVEHLKKIKELPKKDPVTFRSQAEIVDAALDLFLGLSKSKQRDVMAKYLSKKQ